MRRSAVAGIAIGVGFVVGWWARQPAEPVPEVVVRLVEGPARVERAETCADPVSLSCADQDRLALALLGFPDDVPLDPPATETACRARIALAAALTTARQLDAVGRPQPLPPDLPEKYREAAFTAVVRKVVATCPELDRDLRGVDCSEFPCMALFVGSGRRSAASCDAWRDTYGDGQTTSNGVLVGPGGERVHYELVGPFVPPEFSPSEPEPSSEMVWGNGMKRLTSRWQDARDEVIADFGARELTEAEQRDDQRRFWQDQVDQGDEGAARMLEMMEAGWASEDARRAALE